MENHHFPWQTRSGPTGPTLPGLRIGRIADVWMLTARPLAVRRTDLLHAASRLNAQHGVGVLGHLGAPGGTTRGEMAKYGKIRDEGLQSWCIFCGHLLYMKIGYTQLYSDEWIHVGT